MITPFGRTAKVFANPFTVVFVVVVLFCFTIINILLNYYLKLLAIQTKESSDTPNCRKIFTLKHYLRLL